MIAPARITPGPALTEIPLAAGWEMASSEDREIPELFLPAQAPGTVASMLRDQKAWQMGDGLRFDDSHHWFRCRFDAARAVPGEELILRMSGIATLAEVWLNGESILKSQSMFSPHDVDVSALVRDQNELLIECSSLSAALRQMRGRQPAARWRTRIVSEQQLRWFRTTLLGRAPGFSPEPEPVGPWRSVTLVRRRHLAMDEWSRHVALEGSAGVVTVDLRLRVLDEGSMPLSGRMVVGDASAPLELQESAGGCRARSVLRIADAARWSPHTHGEPILYPVRVEFDLPAGTTAHFQDVPAGFRSIDPGADPPGDGGLRLSINGAPVFCRGVVWTPPDVVSLNPSPDVLRDRLTLIRDAGFNLVRVPGTTIYESETFHRLCDELGLLVWQDMMFANMDYPFDDPDFRAGVQAEADRELSRLSPHPSTAVICGNSEIEQQVGMLGLPPIGRGDFFGRELPEIAARCCPGVPYVPSAPCGGDQPFRTRTGVANYFGVGAYLRPLEDVRRAEVKFASECLAFSNVPEPEMIDRMALAHRGGISAIHPAWKRGVPRDAGAGWDFEDVRDHYMKLLYGVDPAALRYADTNRYWELSRMAPSEVMAEVFGEWRRPGSGCGGGIILWGADLEPGAGWGILDSSGWPKAAYWFLKRALAPRSVWMTDEGLNGIDIHVANDRPAALQARLRVAIYRAGEDKIADSEIAIDLPAHKAQTFGVEQVLGRFIDASYAFRFGPPGHDLIVSSLHRPGDEIPFSQAFRFPAGRGTHRTPISELGIAAESRPLEGGAVEILLSSRRFAWGVRVAAAGFLPDDAYFGMEPDGRRRIVLTPVREQKGQPKLVLTAVNAEGRLPL